MITTLVVEPCLEREGTSVAYWGASVGCEWIGESIAARAEYSPEMTQNAVIGIEDDAEGFNYRASFGACGNFPGWARLKSASTPPGSDI